MYRFGKYHLWFGYFLSLSLLNICLVLANISMAFAEENVEYRFERSWPSRLEQPWYFGELRGIEIASDGNVYIADRENHRIQQFSAKGDFIRTWGSKRSGDGQFNIPNGLAISSDGNLYVTDMHNDRIQQFSAKGEFIRAWGSSGSGDGEFNRPSGIAISSDDIICDRS